MSRCWSVMPASSARSQLLSWHVLGFDVLSFGHRDWNVSSLLHMAQVSLSKETIQHVRNEVLDLPNLMCSQAVYIQEKYLHAILWERRIFCRLFHQHVKQVAISTRATRDASPMPILAPTERCGPHVANPGMPQRPELSVKLHKDEQKYS